MQGFTGVVLDLEMTGLNAKTDKIIEIGALKVKEGIVTDAFETLLSPGRLLSERTKEVTRITDEMLSGKPNFAAVAGDVLRFIGEDVLLGHHVLLDYSFLKRALLNVLPKGSRFERMGIDTLKIARAALPAEQKKTLPALCAYYGIGHTPHRALEDARATLLLYEKLQEEFGDREPERFQPRPLLYHVKREVPVMPKQIEQIRHLLEQYHIDCPYDLSVMTKNEASRYYDQLKAELAKSSEREARPETR